MNTRSRTEGYGVSKNFARLRGRSRGRSEFLDN
jgi:hypothetical protein